jgi:hypothetical protein
VAWHAVRAFDAAGPLISRSLSRFVRMGFEQGRAMKRASLPLLVRCMSVAPVGAKRTSCSRFIVMALGVCTETATGVESRAHQEGDGGSRRSCVY